MTDQHGESEAGPLQDDFDSVPEHLEGDAAAGSLLAAHPVRTHLDLPEDGSVAVGLYMTHTTERLYGTAKAIQAILQVGLAWATAHPGHAIGIGDISKRDGGQISGHASHRKGIDLDVRPLRTDGQRRRVTIHDAEYSRELTGKLIQAFVDNGIVPVTHVFFNDAALKKHPVQPWPNHDNHFHVRFKEG
jgi:murein endopeptidase